MGIRRKLALLVPGLVALTWVGVALFTTASQRRDQTDEMRLRNQMVLESVGATAGAYIGHDDMSGLDALMAHLGRTRNHRDLRGISVVGLDGRILADTDPTRFNEQVAGPFFERALSTDGPMWEEQGEVLRIAVPARAGMRRGTVVGEYSLAGIESAFSNTRTTWLLGTIGLAVGLGIALSLGLFVLVIRPVRILQRVALRMGEGDFETKVPPLGSGELGALGLTFNKMAAALKAQRDNLEASVAERTRKLREANERLELLADTDGLTGVFNHRRFQELLNLEASHSEQSQRAFSVVMIDVDHFKSFNDSLGHPAGDELLRRLAQTLRKELRQSDLLSRYGGEEFSIILPDTPRSVALQVAERLRQAVERDLNGPEWGRRVSISLGVATWLEDGDAPRSLVVAADKALYVAKSRGRNQVVSANDVLEQSA